MTLRYLLGALGKHCSTSSAATRSAAIVLALVSFTSTLYAQDDAAVGPPADATPDETPVTPKPASAAQPGPVDKKPGIAETPSVGFVQRLPPTAYPAPYTRGLVGGSLWLSSQGLQWPYLPKTSIGISGYGWMDASYKHLKTGDLTAVKPTTNSALYQGRILLRVTPTYTHGDWFAQAQVELVANKDQSQTQPAVVDADDVWIRVGKWKTFDLTAGRFEAFEVYHLGMGLDLNTDERRGAFDPKFEPPGLYGASFLFYRPSGPGNVAIHLYPTDYLRFEILGQEGNSGPYTTAGVRPAAIFDVGWLKLKAAAEVQRSTSPDDQSKENRSGVAGSAQVVVDPYVEFGANAGYATLDTYDATGNLNTTNSTTTKSFGGFINGRPLPDTLIGLGINHVDVADLHYETPTPDANGVIVGTGRYGDFQSLQTFAALQYFWESQLMIKLVVGYATANKHPTFDPTGGYSNSLYSARLRLQMLF